MQRLFVRSAILVGYAAVVRSLGFDPLPLAREAGIPPRLLASPDSIVSAAAVYRLLERTAETTETPDLGLRIAQQRGSLAYFGALGALARDEPNVRRALHRFATDMHLHTTCIALRVEEVGASAIAELFVRPAGDSPVRQSTECAVGILYWTLRQWLGDAWRPSSVHFTHRRAPRASSHAAMFGCPVRFAAGANLIVMPRETLDHPVPMSDRALRAYAKVEAVSLAPGPRGVVRRERVVEIIEQTLLTGACRSDSVADELGMNRRTLTRHLAQQGVNFSTLLHETRLDLARRHLGDDVLSITEIGGRLGFNSISAFSRWYAASTGVPPSRARKGQSAF